jgi:hypothetical protein
MVRSAGRSCPRPTAGLQHGRVHDQADAEHYLAAERRSAMSSRIQPYRFTNRLCRCQNCHVRTIASHPRAARARRGGALQPVRVRGERSCAPSASRPWTQTLQPLQLATTAPAWLRARDRPRERWLYGSTLVGLCIPVCGTPAPQVALRQAVSTAGQVRVCDAQSRHDHNLRNQS